MQLSVVIITHNEGKNIERCLRSVKSIADDIVVVDSFSTDRTEELCKACGARFFQKTWEGYAKQKNYANSEAVHDWVLSIDADEELSKELQEAILNVKHSFKTPYYRINRLTNYCGRWIRHCGWYPEPKLRLFDRGHARWEGEYIHETLKVDVTKEAPLLPGDCYHYSYESIHDHVERADIYSSLKAEKIFHGGRRFSLLNLILRPIFRFAKMYIIKLGFLDGYHGLELCVISAYSEFLTYAKLRYLTTPKLVQAKCE